MKRISIGTLKPYQVLIGKGLLGELGALVAQEFGRVRCAVVTDSNVDRLYAARALGSLRSAGLETEKFVFPAGEGSKSLETLGALLNFLAEKHLTRSDLIVALGGGVVGDLAGFAAATYLRGIRLVQVPTTLLAAVDSSVGGKTAVNLAAGKNLAGAFHQPSLVVCDPDALGTLPEPEWASGAGEVIKTALLAGGQLLSMIRAAGWRADASAVIARCVSVKNDYVSGDEFDRGKRQLLNLGHTFGHAIEKVSGFGVPHGQAVAMGLMMAARAADWPVPGLRALGALIRANGLEPRCSYSPEALCRAALGDKKRMGDTIALVLPAKVGACELKKVPIDELPDWFAKSLARQEVTT